MVEVGVVRRRHRRRLWLMAALVVIAAAIGVGPRFVRSAFASRPWPIDLHSVGAPCENDPAWVCAGIQVPVDRSTAGTGTTTVEFRVLPRRLVTQPSAGTIVVVSGGPGDASMNQYAWAEKAFASLHDDHDLLLVDNRGSGASNAIDCPELQQRFTPQAIAACRAILGHTADDFSTVAAVDDLQAVLTRVHSSAVDMYGQSYGTFFAQTFALRYPKHLQRLVLDGALPLDSDPWHRDSTPAGLAGLRVTCRADPVCRASGDPVTLLARALVKLRTGGTRRGGASLGAEYLASLIHNAGRLGSAYRELPAALRAYLSGDQRPLFRLLDEAGGGAAGTDSPVATNDSIGLQVADDCADEPQPFDLRAPVAVQKRELAAAYKRVSAATAAALLPFLPQEAMLNGGTCLGWPAPTQITPQELGHNFPDVPTLVLEGGLDTVTPAPGARSVANAFPGSRYIEIPFVGHVTATNDKSGCAASIAATFFANGHIDTGCLAHIVPPSQVDAFPPTFAEEAPIAAIDNHSTASLSANDRRTMAVARNTISDVIWRWGRLGEVTERGLWGGTATSLYTGAPGEYHLHLNKLAWTSDTSITGNLDIDFAHGADSMNAALDVTTPKGRAHLTVRSAHIVAPSNVETITATLHGTTISVTVSAKLPA